MEQNPPTFKSLNRTEQPVFKSINRKKPDKYLNLVIEQNN